MHTRLAGAASPSLSFPEVHLQLSEVGGGEVTGDVQKKITRWARGAGVLDELFPGLPSSSQDEGAGRQPSGLVLVASLLNKIPNLGG